MKKCTLCIDRIYNETLPEIDRVPACVSTCPASARHFGDLGDPESDVSQLVAERGGKELMPEMGYKPINRYLPPRAAKKNQGASGVGAALSPIPTEDASGAVAGSGKFLRWVDRVLSR
jgi:Fe-S-cluster-containing dehydrogenase component